MHILKTTFLRRPAKKYSNNRIEKKANNAFIHNNTCHSWMIHNLVWNNNLWSFSTRISQFFIGYNSYNRIKWATQTVTATINCPFCLWKGNLNYKCRNNKIKNRPKMCNWLQICGQSLSLDSRNNQIKYILEWHQFILKNFTAILRIKDLNCLFWFLMNWKSCWKHSVWTIASIILLQRFFTIKCISTLGTNVFQKF